MIKKMTKILGTIFTLLTAHSLSIPIYKTRFEDGETWDLTLRGIELSDFSVWGILTLIIPFLLAAVMFTGVSDKTKSLLVIGIFTSGTVSVYNAYIAMREWIYSEATGLINSYSGLMYYTIAFLVASLFFYINSTIKDK